MAQRTKLAAILNGLVQNVDLTGDELVLDSVRLGGGSGTLLTKTILDGLISNSHASGSDNQNIVAGDGLTGGGSGSTVTIDVNVDNSTIEINTDALRLKDGAVSAAKLSTTAITGQTAETVADDADLLLIYDDSTTSLKKMSRSNFLSGTSTDEKVKVSANDTTTGYIEDKFVVDNGSNTTNPLEASTLNDGGNEDYRIRFDQSKVDHGSIAGLGDDDHTIYTKADGTRAFTGDQSFGGFKATNLADPSSNQDAVTLAYMNARLAGIKPKAAVRVATTGAGTLATSFENGDSIDGVTLVTGDRILIKDQSTASENGIYVVNASGAPTRATDFDSVTPVDEINGAWVSVQEGTANAGKIFTQFGTVTTVGTDDINFEYFNPIAGLIGGDMITFSSSTFSVDLATTSGLESTNPGNAAGQLKVKLEASNPSLQVNGSNELGAKLDAAGAITTGASGLKANTDGSTLEIATNALQVKDAGISTVKIANDAVDKTKINADVAGSGLGQNVDGSLEVNVDNSTIEINTDSLQVKDAGITLAKLASDSVDENKIKSSALGTTLTGGSGSVLNVLNTPLVKKTMVAGESFAANTSFLVRFAVNGETAARQYKADSAAATTNGKFWAVGIALSTGAVSAGQNIDVTILGTHTLGSSDTPFNATDIGKSVWLTSTGAFSITAPSSSGSANYKIGIVEDTNKIFLSPQFTSVN